MQLPLQITFRHMETSAAVEERIRTEAVRLERFYDHIIACRVVVEAPHHHHHQGQLFHIRINVTVPGDELTVSREQHDKHAREDAYVAIRDAFNALQRQLEDYARRRRGKIKAHEIPPHGRVKQLFPQMDYGTIEAADGREIYFHKNSIVGAAFDELEEGFEVRFVETQGEKGPQASTVQLIGKHHIHG